MNKIKSDRSTIAVKIFSYTFVSIFALLCLFPFVLMVSSSFSTETAIMRDGIGLLPKEFTLEAYELAFASPKLLIGSYILTITMTVLGTICGLFLITMTGYALQRPDFGARNKISFFIYFTTLFSGGLAPTYLWITKYLGLMDSYLAVFLPLLMSPWLIFLMKNFIRQIPFEITESGKIDGAGDFRIYISLVLPMLKPALATVGLFLALGYWNEWYNSMLYLQNASYYPLQYYLYRIVNLAAYLKQSMAGANVVIGSMPTNTIKMSTAVLATGPIIFVYPFIQKYFITGMTVGAVKG